MHPRSSRFDHLDLAVTRPLLFHSGDTGCVTFPRWLRFLPAGPKLYVERAPPLSDSALQSPYTARNFWPSLAARAAATFCRAASWRALTASSRERGFR